MFTHVIKSSNQKCFMSVWWPSRCAVAIDRERQWPMITTESGQTTRVRKDNLRKITEIDRN